MKEFKKLPYNLSIVISKFDIEGQIVQVQPYGTGHIHDTFHAINVQPELPDYLLQRTNHYVFKDIPALTNNIQIVTNHLRKRLKAEPGAEPDKEVLKLVLSKKKQGYYQDEEGNYWRMYYFLKNTRSHDVVKSRQQAYEGGRGFGRFLALLSDLNPKSLSETIPKFHDVESRLQLFLEAIERNPKNRVKDLSTEISFVKDRADAMRAIYRSGQRGVIPLRITHNDTKFNNILLNNSGRAQCVIDLDTVMPGYTAYDFGDGVRTIINTAPEDEQDLYKIKLNIRLFEAFTEGFLQETRGFLYEEEINSLTQGVLLLPFIMGLRFLTDYIDGDHYYKIQFPDHNIQRARAQFKLVEELEKQEGLLTEIIHRFAKTSKEEIINHKPLSS
jgi:hypothetical protein